MLQCCDHPYLIDQSLQSSLTKGHPLTDILDIGVQSSGKLLLLDKMLQELKAEGLRVLTVCQVRLLG
jgi:SNF2 family DNA or RNA helicase